MRGATSGLAVPIRLRKAAAPLHISSITFSALGALLQVQVIDLHSGC